MRYILLDRVTQAVPGKIARGLKAVTLTDDVLHDHFPDYPILAGRPARRGARPRSSRGFSSRSARTSRATSPVVRSSSRFTERSSTSPRRSRRFGRALRQLSQGLDAAAKLTVGADIRGERSMRGTLTFMLRTIDSARVHEQRRYLYSLWTRDLPEKVWTP